MLIKLFVFCIVIAFATVACSHKETETPERAPHKTNNKFHYKNVTAKEKTNEK